MKITKLPCEIVAEILGQLDKVQYLRAPLLSCRLFHDAFTQRPRLAQQIVRKQIPKQLLPYAVVLVHASRVNFSNSTYNVLNLTPEDADTLVFSFTFEGDIVLTSSFPTFSLPQLMTMGTTHELVAEFASQFAGKAWSAIADTLNNTIYTKSMSSHPDLSEKECLRFCRCFYRVELYHGVFTVHNHDEARNVYVTQGNSSLQLETHLEFGDRLRSRVRMLADLAPWEIEQLVAAVEYLDSDFKAATTEALASDAIRDRPISTDKWLCKGLAYLRNLKKKSCVEKRGLLDRGTPMFPARFYLHLRMCHDDRSKALHDTKLDASLQGPDLSDMDDDEGPRKVLSYIDSSYVLKFQCKGLRERAYVFWDNERLEQYDIYSAISSRGSFWTSTAHP